VVSSSLTVGTLKIQATPYRLVVEYFDVLLFLSTSLRVILYLISLA
jgi:hypothetical protein